MSCGEQWAGAGEVYAERAGSNTGLLMIANTPLVQTDVATTVERAPNNDSIEGGNCSRFDLIDSITVQIDIQSYDTNALELLLAGDATARAAAPVTDVNAIARENALIKTSQPMDPSQTITVQPTGGGTAFTVNTDYTISPAGIVIRSAADGGTITAGDGLDIAYTSVDSDIVQAFLRSTAEYHVVLEGLNRFPDGAAVVLDMFKVVFGPAAQVGWKSRTTQQNSLVGELLSDSTKVGTGISKFMTAEKFTQIAA